MYKQKFKNINQNQLNPFGKRVVDEMDITLRTTKTRADRMVSKHIQKLVGVIKKMEELNAPYLIQNIDGVPFVFPNFKNKNADIEQFVNELMYCDGYMDEDLIEPPTTTKYRKFEMIN